MNLEDWADENGLELMVIQIGYGYWEHKGRWKASIQGQLRGYGDTPDLAIRDLASRVKGNRYILSGDEDVGNFEITFPLNLI